MVAALHRHCLAAALLFATTWPAAAYDGCGVLTARLDQIAGRGPAFLRSYDHERGDGPAAEPALNAAFTYDNALAVIALVACGAPERASRIGRAFLTAIESDRAGPRGRLRNAYRPGPVVQKPVPPMGWWSEADKMWIEDPYQVGTATGNVAWAALAMLTLHEAMGGTEWRAGAEKLARWAVANTATPNGFTGGIFGDGARAQPLTWKSTEHNIDLAAVFLWLARTDASWEGEADGIRNGFLEVMWDGRPGRFATGTLPDGHTVNWQTSGLDAQLWPVLLPDAPRAWARAIDYAAEAHGVSGGFDFNDDRDGLWVEGTAQASLSYRVIGRAGESEKLLSEAARHQSPSGYLYATREARLTTGLAISPESTTDDFLYYRRPHLAATAWAVLAAQKWNPLTGKRVP
jgi:hypothetical protein